MTTAMACGPAERDRPAVVAHGARVLPQALCSRLPAAAGCVAWSQEQRRKQAKAPGKP